MKFYKLLLILLGIILSACAAPATEPAPTPMPTATQIPTNTPAPTSNTLNYFDEVAAYIEVAERGPSTLMELYALAEANPAMLEDETWLTLVNATLDEMSRAADRILSIEHVPSQAENLHSILTVSAEEMQLIVLYQKQFIETGDQSAFAKFSEHANAYIVIMDEFVAEMERMAVDGMKTGESPLGPLEPLQPDNK